MYRIIHLSDLHLTQSGAHLTDMFHPKPPKVDVLGRLRTLCQSLRPNAIVVTGDLTDRGDPDSFRAARDLLHRMMNESGAQLVLCVPGNHDLYGWRILGVIPCSIYRPLKNYTTELQTAFGEPFPDKPHIVDTTWGRIAFFMFNSCDPKLRNVNEGRISDDQRNRLNSYMAKHREDDAIRIALLHHHPISAPSVESDLQQKLTLMRDGTHFVENLKRADFHVIMHGHQHAPFYSASWIQTSPTAGTGSLLHVLAAGSALRHDNGSPSFNVLDILSPFTAQMRRFDFDSCNYGGFSENESESRLLQLSDPKLRLDALREQAASVRTENPRDSAATNLRRLEPAGVDRDHRYEKIEYIVEIDHPNRHYLGKYRRRGTVVAEESEGWLYVLVGEPGVTWDELKLRPIDNLGSTTLGCRAIVDDPRRKIIRVVPTLPLTRGAEFDITLEFRWPTAAHDPNDYDGFNLLYFDHQIDRLRYEVTVPWTPGQLRVWSCGRRVRPERVDWKHCGSAYAFEIAKPAHVPYLVEIGEKPL